MRHSVLLFLVLFSGYVMAQKPMAGNYKWLGKQFYADTLYIDTSTYDISAGTTVTIDTTGSSESGFYTIVLGAGGGTGDVDGPASATDNAITRFDGTTGKIIQNSAVTMADGTGSLTVPTGWSAGVTSGASITLNTTTSAFATPANGTTASVFTIAPGIQSQSSAGLEVLTLSPTYDQTATAGATDFSITRTETALGSGEHNFVKLSSGAVPTEKLRIDNAGVISMNPDGVIAIDINGASQAITFDGGALSSDATDVTITSAGAREITLTSGDGIDLISTSTTTIASTTSTVLSQGGDNVLSIVAGGAVIESTSDDFTVESQGSEPVLFVDQTATGEVGIGTDTPLSMFHIRGASSSILITLESNEVGTPGAGTGTITDLPNDATPGNPIYVKATVNGQNGYLIFYVTP